MQYRSEQLGPVFVSTHNNIPYIYVLNLIGEPGRMGYVPYYVCMCVRVSVRHMVVPGAPCTLSHTHYAKVEPRPAIAYINRTKNIQ